MVVKKIDKKGQMLYEQIIFIALNVFIFSALLFFIWRSTSDVSVAEEIMAKKLALIIDGMKPGMEVNMSLASFYKIMEKTNFNEFPIKIENNLVTVKAEAGVGYSFRFFSDLSPLVSINRNDINKTLTIKT
jgi:hypothetical protein